LKRKGLTLLLVSLLILSFFSCFKFGTVSAISSLTFTETGLASGTSWNVTLDGTTHSSTTDTVTFTGIDDGDYAYTIGTPAGYICGSATTGTITVSSADVNKPVTFASTSGDSWPMFHHDIMHTGYATSYAPVTNQTIWATSMGSRVAFSSPAVVGGVAYFGDSSGNVRAFNTTTGVHIWSYPTGSTSQVASSPAVVDGKVYIGAWDNQTYCLDAATGAKIWNYTTGDAVFSSPTVVNGVVYIGSYDKTMYALDAATGAKIWNYTTSDLVTSAACVVDGVVYFGSYDDKLYALDAATGVQIWNYSAGGALVSSPCVVDGLVYFGSFSGYVYAVNAASGSLNWSYNTDENIFLSSPAVAYGAVYIGTWDNTLCALNATTGVGIWNYTTGNRFESSPAVAGGVVYVGSWGNKVYAFNATDGDVIWSYTTGALVSSSPAVVDGVVYVASYDGNLYAFGVPPQYSLTMKTVGHGSVLPGNQTYNNGTLVDLVAIPDEGWLFSGWSGDATGTTNTTILMFGNKTVTATFVEAHTLTVIVVGQGDVSPSNQSFPVGTVVDITATGATGWSFSGWSGDLTGTTNPTSITMDSNKTVTATFTPIPYSVVFTESGLAAGTSWNVTFNGVTQSSTTNTITFSGIISGSYAYSISTPTGYVCNLAPTGTLTVTGADVNQRVTFVSSSGGSWPMFHHDVLHTGYSASNGPVTNNTLWKTILTGGVKSSAAIVDGVVYVGSDDGNVYAFNASTGTKIWNYTTGGSVVSSPTVVDGVVYVGSLDRDIYALNASTGAKIWNYHTNGAVYSSPSVADGVVYVGSDDRYLHSINATTGTRIWFRNLGGYIRSSPIVVDGKIYVTIDQRIVICFEASTALPLIVYRTMGMASAPTIVDGVLYVGSYKGFVYALNATVDQQIWAYATGGSVVSSPAVAGGVVYVGSDDGNVYAFNASTGAKIWNYTTGGMVKSSPAVAGGIVYVGSNDGYVYAFNASTGSLLWKYETGGAVGASPALANGVLYVGSEDGTMYAFSIPQYTLTVITVGQGTVTPSNQTCLLGTVVDLQAMAAAGWSFSGWSGDLSGTTNPSSIIINDNKTVTATFTKNSSPPPQQYVSLTVSINGTGCSVTKNPNRATYTYGTYVQLTAVAASGWTFSGWSGDLTGTTNPILITMKSNKTITANFSPNTCDIVFAASGIEPDFTGTVITIDDVDYVVSMLPLSFTWTVGSEHTFAYASSLSASSGKQYTWSSTEGLSNLQNGSLTVSGSGNVTGNFKTQYYLTVTSAHGTTGGSGWYDAGTFSQATLNTLTMQVNAGTKATFIGWTGHASGSTSTSNSILMDSPKTATATWRTQYYLTVNSAYGSTTGEGWYDSGSTVYAALTAGKVSGGTGTQHVFAGWDGDASGSELTSNAITMSAPKTATANWMTQYQLTITASANSGGNMSLAAGVSLEKSDSQVTITANPQKGYTFAYWLLDGKVVTGNTLSLSMNCCHTVQPVFDRLNCTLTILPSDNGSTNSTTGSCSYSYGTNITVTATPAAGYLFDHWLVDGATFTNSTITITADQQHTAQAFFVAEPMNLAVPVALTIVVICLALLVLLIMIRRRKKAQ